MADFTKEEVLALYREYEGTAATQQAARKWKIVSTALLALAKSMDAEPVFWGWRREVDGHFHDAVFRSREQAADEQKYHHPGWVAGYTIQPLYLAPPVSTPAEPVAAKALEDVVEWHKKEIAGLEGQIERNNAYKRKVGSHDDSANQRCRSAIHHHRWSIDAVLRIRSALAEQPAPVEAVAAVPADVVELVIAAREAWEDPEDEERHTALDRALEAFASRVPYENDPDDEAAALADQSAAAPQPASQNGEER